jgi:hypothetical protein
MHDMHTSGNLKGLVSSHVTFAVRKKQPCGLNEFFFSVSIQLNFLKVNNYDYRMICLITGLFTQQRFNNYIIIISEVC